MCYQVQSQSFLFHLRNVGNDASFARAAAARIGIAGLEFTLFLVTRKRYPPPSAGAPELRFFCEWCCDGCGRAESRVTERSHKVFCFTFENVGNDARIARAAAACIGAAELESVLTFATRERYPLSSAGAPESQYLCGSSGRWPVTFLRNR